MSLIHHIEINVSDLSASKAFWSWLLEKLGFSKYQEWEQGFSYKEGDSYIVFVQTSDRFLDESYHRGRTGLNHLALAVDTKHEVDELYAELQRRNIPLLYPERHPFAGGKEHYAVFFEDPDRIKVEVAARPASGQTKHIH
ncbi:catechol 2,3-dioxygenase-like lactoylglutathione lyase family enzyme [Trichococcus patagoniensis]|uniref:Catechol 2,3-dioxygenase-like lactoylglutathione lyase family enzyme n=1 Tax=Trichococcus patagoniensis TaxID=382641 RepID=A0A2T5IMB2_9LACT|nr:VOC family protein [Trichococcus patagoniensis]PTQ84910.1 catechol 2,3-dioxygenase-like lactoylglutathione lyase family enzyme [Trichococcus patagoniensis]